MVAVTNAFAHKLERTHWSTAIYAAFIAGIAYLVLQTLAAGLVYQVSPWLPIRLIASIALGDSALPETGFPLAVTLAAFLIHFGLSIMTAWVLAPFIEGEPRVKALAIGVILGLIIYLVNYFLLTLAFDSFIVLRGWITLLCHLVFGLVLAWSYQTLRVREQDLS